MKKDNDGSELRRRAEEQLRKRGVAADMLCSQEELERLVQELSIHQIELEMQNEELQDAMDEIEREHNRYLNLYDFAPVGYLTLARDGTILQANLTIARILSFERSRLLGVRFGSFLDQRVLPEKSAQNWRRSAARVNMLLYGMDNSVYYIEDVYRVRTVCQYKPKENIMSLNQARLFIERMKSDEAFSKRVMAIEDVAGRLACIQSEGFACSEAEIKEVAGELSDAELDGAAGGAMGKIIAKAWADEAYKLRLINNPAVVLKEEGLPVPEPPTTKHPESQKGSLLVEFALILPVFLSLILGMITFSFALYNKTILTRAVQNAARAGSIYSTDANGLAITDADRQTNATNAFTTACGNYLISMSVPTPSIPTPFPSTSPNRFITVSAKGDYNSNLYIFNKIFGISSLSYMRIEE